MKPTFANPVLPKTGTVVVPILDGRKLLASAKNLDKQMKGGLMRAIKASQFKGSKGHSLHLLAPAGTKLDR
ncbi:MAG: leucyl aminopeptidase, partial [Rhodospirillaceae bacterium]|nr:leucyl aminopeptidase [Rhodospirillaceae bacterium]